MAIWNVLKGAYMLWKTRDKTEARMRIGLGIMYPKVTSCIQEIDKALVGNREENERDGNFLFHLIKFSIHSIEEKTKNTPDDQEVDPDGNIVSGLEKMESGIVSMMQSIVPKDDGSGKVFHDNMWDYIGRLQEIRNRIVERDCLLSPVVGKPFTDRKGFLLAIRDD